MKQKVKRLSSIIGLIFFPAVYFYLLEAYTHNGFTEVRIWPQVFSIILYIWVAVILFFLFRSVKLALWIEGAFAMLFGLVNYYVYTFRSLPLAPWDIFSVKTALNVADSYNFMPSFQVVCVVAGFLELDLKKWKWHESLVLAVVFCLGFGAFVSILQKEDFQNRHLMYNKLFTPVYMWQVNGFALTMVMQMPYLAVEKPKGYQKEEAKELLDAYEPEKETEPAQKPNIIVIMDEAFSDLGVLGEFSPSEDYMPYFRSMFQDAKNTVTGYLSASVCGGNTANTEFEFLTGHTMAFLPQGSVPYQQYIKHEIPALPSYLRDLGYETYAMHPYLSNGWDRESVYPLLGFSHMEFLESYKNCSYVRKFVSDESCVDKLIETFEQKEPNQPMFAFQVTMQNHGSYGDAYENFTPHITVEGASSYSLSTYLSLIQKTDQALERLISYFSKQEEPVLVVFFGDHQPNDVVAEPIWQLQGKSYRSLTEEENKLRYQVPYLIWANYEIGTENDADMSVNYLGGKVLETAGLPLSAYQNYLKGLSKSYPVLSAAERPNEEAAQPDIEEYKKLQYYQLFEKQD